MSKINGLNVVSCYDGMACGMISFRELGIPINRYIASEIDKTAILVAKHNFPEIEEIGDIFNADFTQYQGFDFLIGGSPCTYWSIAKKEGRETEAKGLGWELFSQYIRALNEVKPKYFIYENNKSMNKNIRDSIRNSFGFNEICINSSLVSAQNRERYYWIGKRNNDGTYSKVSISQPKDKNIVLCDIINDLYSKPITMCKNNKAHTIKAGYYKQGMANFITNGGHQATAVAEKVLNIDKSWSTATSREDKRIHLIYKVSNHNIVIKNKSYPIDLDDGFYIIRKLSVEECMKLQTIPSWYKFPVSASKSYQLLGNGWTSSVIQHLIKGCLVKGE